MSLVLNGTTGADKVQSGSIYPEDLVQKMTLMTAQTASGTSVDFTGIPSWAKRITVMFDGVSTNGSSPIQVQLGDSGGIETTGYSGASSIIGVSVATASFTTGYLIYFSNGDNAAYSRTGNMDICLKSVLVYTSNFVVSNNIIATSIGAYSKTLSAELATVRITTVNGTDTFDAGTINIMYEG